MSIEAKRFLVAALALLFLASLIVVAYREVRREPRAGEPPRAVVPADSRDCVKCHREVSPTIVLLWERSKHAERGIGCTICHAAGPKDVDGYEHHGARIATIVSPLDCSRCHAQEYKEQQQSRHAEAADVAGSLDAFLAAQVEGESNPILGCQGCHGSVVKVLANGKLDPATWPNGGIGRVNPDGSKGTCAACHSRHDFSIALARSPEACAKCHSGPKAPDADVYEHSKHGLRFAALRDQMNLGKQPWFPGTDYHAPTCATCHMSAMPRQPVTHDVGARLAWSLLPEVSVQQKDGAAKREKMVDVCMTCHSEPWVSNYFDQFDAQVKLYDERFARPARKLMDSLYAAKALTRTPFDESIEYSYFELWHNEGRRARLGAAMMAPDFVEWRGMYQVAKQFYSVLLPQAEKLSPGIGGRVLGPEHNWRKGLAGDAIKQAEDWNRKHYGAQK